MAGRTIRICPPRTFNFDDLANTDTDDEMVITIAERIDASQYTAADLVVRVVSDVTVTNGSSYIQVRLVSDGFTPDDPSQDFFSSTALASADYTANASAGDLKVAAATDLGSMLAVQIAANAEGSAATLNGRFAIDLVLKTD